jgi:DNA-binding MarR family transcriptional regulator
MVASKRAQLRRDSARTTEASNDRDLSETVDYATLARFRYELRKFQAFSKAAADQAGLTPQQHQALLTIRGFSNQEPVSVGDLADFLFIRHHTAVGLVDRMTKLELLTRVVDDADGRRKTAAEIVASQFERTPRHRPDPGQDAGHVQDLLRRFSRSIEDV